MLLQFAAPSQYIASASSCTRTSFCNPLIDRRVGKQLILAKKERFKGSGRGRGIVRCSSRVAEEASSPWSAKELEEKFGQEGVKFMEAAGYRIAEMKLTEGSSARILLQNAFVASYKSKMWHGGVEELLYTAVVPGLEKLTTVGGVALRLWEDDDKSKLLANAESWDVETVRSNPSQYVQVTLSTSSKSQSGATLEFKYVLTLTEAALSCALISTNVGTTPVNIHGSFQTSVAVNFVDGVYAVGLQGYKYQSQENLTTEEEEQMVQMIGGIDRVYTDIEDSVSLLDRGKRRTINFQSVGFVDVRLSNPGAKSGNEDWDTFVDIEFTRLSRGVNLQPGEEWRAAQQLENPSK